ncbi:MAG: hypothetical protein LC732_04900, partial [Acidobacteria bacterium]|nr:hypothetical protein [Acidobacteriota bacterium]
FGSIELSLFPGGLSGKAMMLRGFSRNAASAITVKNPLARLYAEVPIANVRPMILSLAGWNGAMFPRAREFPLSNPQRGKVGGLDAMRYQVRLGPASSIDVWSTTAIPAHPQYRRLAREFASAVSPAAASLLDRIPGTPVYVELNTTHHRKVVLLRVKGFSRAADGEEAALTLGRAYIKAPGSDFFLR